MSYDWYEMRRGGETLCGSAVPNLGYPLHWLKDMAKQGIHLYKNGRRVKLCDITST
jgi:hypothetical protein